jgi:glucose-1-phosphate cytidylyltransferase
MQVVILCGGLGTRLREETEFKPKPMVNIGERPILWHIMKHYAAYGITDFVLALGYKGDFIKEYFYNYELLNNDVTLELGKPDSFKVHNGHNGHDEAGWKITLVDTGPRTLKGGRLKQVEKYITGNIFMMTYGDGVSDINLNALRQMHEEHGNLATVTGISPVSRYGELKLDGGKVVSFSEKPDQTSEYINAGFFVFNREIFDYLTADEDCDLEFGAMERIAAEGELMVYRHDGFWACMDTQRDVDYLNDLWNKGEAPWKYK